jgi:glutamyl endopeptidase
MNSNCFPQNVGIKFESSMIERYKDRKKDSRIRVQDSSVYPFSCIGPLVSKQLDGKFYLGTATLIADQYIITAAHNPYEDSFRAPEFYFAPGLNGQNSDFEYSVGYEFFVFDSYIQNLDDKYIDIAVMKLEKPLGLNYGTMDLVSFDKEKHKDLNFYGYPGDMYKNAKNSYQMWGGEINNPNVSSTGEMKFTCDSYSGMSGAAIYHLNYNLRAQIVGIFWGHDFVNDNCKTGYATSIDNDIISQIEKYILESK